MSEVASAQAPAEVQQPLYNRAKTRALALSLMAGLTLAACTGEPSADSPTSTSAAPTAPETTLPSTLTTPTITEATPTPTSTHPTTQPSGATGLEGCIPYLDISKYNNHEYEVCTAYIANSAQIALQGFYKYGNSKIGYLSTAARHHFETRYWDQPREAIEREVAGWPHVSNLSGNEVEETISLISLSSNLKADRGLVQTQESWKVTNADGQVLYNEPQHIKDVTMCKGQLPGHPLHLWFVVSNTQIPDFDCIGFDRSHGLNP